MDGNILSWERENWNLTSPYNRSQMEILDFDRDVCSQPKVRWDPGEGTKCLVYRRAS